MVSLHVVYENFTVGYKDLFLDCFSIVAILCGIFVIVSKNPIVSICAPFWIFLANNYLYL